MLKVIKSKERGFTLIEIVIVLAIAALILLAVFLAVGGAQRTQRDQARKSIAGRVGSAIANYASNNNGTLPTAGTALGGNYLNGITDPDTGAAPAAEAAGSSADGKASGGTGGVIYTTQAICSGGATTATGATASNYAISYWSENANAAQCVDNK